MNLGFEPIKVLFRGGDSPFEPGEVFIEPLESGFAITLGNALRRILYSSMPGASTVGMRIEGARHQLDFIPGSATDALELSLNLKSIRFKVSGDGLYTVRFKQNKPGMYYAKDLDLPPEVEVTTPDKPLLNVTGESVVDIEIYVKNGKGYVDASEQKDVAGRVDIIPLDSLFTPVVNVEMAMEPVRIEGRHDYERLKLKITTDGSLHPKDAILVAQKILKWHLNFLEGMSDFAEEIDIEVVRQEEQRNLKLDMPIENLELSIRSLNVLQKEKCKTVKDILKYSKLQLKGLPNIGTRSLNEIVEKMKELGFELK